jgi:hypothetical protein
MSYLVLARRRLSLARDYLLATSRRLPFLSPTLPVSYHLRDSASLVGRCLVILPPSSLQAQLCAQVPWWGEPTRHTLPAAAAQSSRASRERRASGGHELMSSSQHHSSQQGSR